jgi:hypothetical protein
MIDTFLGRLIDDSHCNNNEELVVSKTGKCLLLPNGKFSRHTVFLIASTALPDCQGGQMSL